MLSAILLAVIAPLAVVFTLPDVRSTFLIYQLGICLVVPAIHSLSTRGSHLDALGLRPRSRASVLEGLATGAVLGGGAFGALSLAEGSLLDPAAAQAALIGWGIDPEHGMGLLAFMVLVSGPAEELFWRGWIHGKLGSLKPRAAVLALTTAGYASYHLVTLDALLPSAGAVAVAFAGVTTAGGWWAWRRERRGDVWAPLLGHAGAVAGYMAAWWVHVR